MRRPRGSRLRPAACSAVLMILTSGCGYFEQLLGELPLEVDPRRIFLVARSQSLANGQAEPIFGAASELWGFDPCAGSADKFRGRLRLASLFTAELPSDQGWVPAESPQATILVHYRDGSPVPTAYVYAEKIGAGGAATNSHPFLERLDQRLTLPNLPGLRELHLDTGRSAISTAVQPIQRSAEKPVEARLTTSTRDSSASGLAQSNALTVPSDSKQGRLPQPPTANNTISTRPKDGNQRQTDQADTLAVGYRSRRGSFSGWKWIGTCAPSGPLADAWLEPSTLTTTTAATDRPFLRLARSEGQWRLSPGDEALPALQVLATVTMQGRPNYGIRLAMVCRMGPDCQDAPTLARLIGSLRATPNSSSFGDRGWPQRDLQELATDVGIELAPMH